MMDLYPAVDLFSGKAVRLLHGDYTKMTVYNEHPEAVVRDVMQKGASHLHIVDLEGAKSGGTPNFETVAALKKAGGLFCEVGGGIRSMDVIEKYLAAGLDRVILGTAAASNPAFLEQAAREYGKHLAVGADIKDGYLAVNGWTETTDETIDSFILRLLKIGVGTVICTDISKDGALSGTNTALYVRLRKLLRGTDMQLIASGGITDIRDLTVLRDAGVNGAIVGTAYYTGAIDLREAVSVCKGQDPQAGGLS